ncbi:hypothetical protein IFM89_014323 [Coptis chinensis]|uniref:Transposase MuDR plant domain-containing protein n=1 Tax=Coptis chinensis TaxID=261450 RepID=A0A835HQP1_9MAGN|nr:hypothetical protein IFM89_014323 [Coptis chinensis]
MDTKLPEYVDVLGLATDDPIEIDDEIGFRNPPRQPRNPQIDQLDPDKGYHITNSSDEEIEWQQPRSDEFYKFVYETSNVYVDEGEIVMPTCSNEWKVGMEWPDIETLRHEILDYCIKNRFKVNMRIVNERYMIRAKCKGYYKGKDCPWVAYWRLRHDAFTMRLNTFVNEHICSVDLELKNGMANANWVARKIAPQMKVHYKTMSPRFIMAEVMRGDFHVSISYWTAWHARLKCLQDIHGNYGASYNMLPVLCDQESTYKLAYMGHIMPIPNMSEWPKNCNLEKQIIPPPYVGGIRRPKKAKTRGADEEVNPNKQIRLCSKCKQPRHNAKTCKGLPTVKKDKHDKKSQEETQQASAPVPEEALESTQASQASSSKAAKRKYKHGKKSQEETQASQASAPVPDEAKKSTQTSQVSAPVPEEALESTQSASSKAAQRVCKKKYVESTSEGPAPTDQASKSKSSTKSKMSATKSTTEATPKSSLQASQASSLTPQSTAHPATLTFGPPRAPEQRHTFGDFLSKQLGKSSTSVLEATELTFTAGGTVRAPIATKRPRPHGPGSTPFMPAGPSSQPWVPPGQVGDAPFKATKKILPPLAPSPLPTSRKKFQVVRPK